MFASSRQFAVSTMSPTHFLKSNYKRHIFSEYSNCLSIPNQKLSNTEYSNDNKSIGNIVTKRWHTSGNSENLSYHRHHGAVPITEITVGKLLEKAVEKWQNRECIVSVHQGVRLTYKDVLRRADKLAAGLLKLGLERGDRVAIWGPNEIEWFISFLAIVRAGFIMVGINPAYQQSEIDYCIEHVNARAVIGPERFKTQNYADMLIRTRKTCLSLQHIVVYSDDHVTGTRRFADVESLANNTEVQAIAAMQNEISPYDACNIQFTSGTTGKPKAVLLSHRSFVNNTRQGADRLELSKDHHKICLNIPLFHAFGLIFGQFATFHSGATLVLEAPAYNPKLSVETIIREKCTVSCGTPTMWIHLLDTREKLKAPIDTLRCGVTGGSLVSPAIMRRIREQLRFDVIQSIYGLTETTGASFQSLPGESVELADNTVGHVGDHLEAMVVDNNGTPVPYGTPGELWIRGYCTMMKYWNDEENTKKTMNEDGWLKTGDQFVLTANGYGQVVGRLKDVIIRGGENIYPKEIEHFLETHPDVLEAHAFGVHDDVYGEEICACVRLSTNSKLTKNELRTFAKGRIAHFKIPRYIEFVENHPRTTSGKIQKFKLRQQLEERGIVPVKSR